MAATMRALIERPLTRVVLALGASSVALAVLGVAVRLGPVPIDAADTALAELRERGVAAPILAAFDTAGSLPVWAALIIVLALWLARRSIRGAIELVVISLIAEGAATLVKLIVSRPRPEGGPTADLIVAAGFPSGHVTRVAVLVGVGLVLIPWGARHPRLVVVAGLALVTLMGIARVSARAHYTSDVLGAWLLAAALLAVWELVRSRQARDLSSGTRRPASPASDRSRAAAPR